MLQIKTLLAVCLLSLICLNFKLEAKNIKVKPKTQNTKTIQQGESMGAINPFITHSINIKLQNAQGASVGFMRISASYHQHEDGVLNPQRPSGPDNRKIVRNYQGVNIGVTFTDKKSGYEEKVQTLAESLKKNGGLQLENTKEIITFEDGRFIDSLNTFMLKEYGLKAQEN